MTLVVGYTIYSVLHESEAPYSAVYHNPSPKAWSCGMASIISLVKRFVNKLNNYLEENLLEAKLNPK